VDAESCVEHADGEREREGESTFFSIIEWSCDLDFSDANANKLEQYTMLSARDILLDSDFLCICMYIFVNILFHPRNEIASWFACQAFEKLALSLQKPLGDGWISG